MRKALELLFTTLISITLLCSCSKVDSDKSSTEIVKFETDINGRTIITKNVYCDYENEPQTPGNCGIYTASVKSFDEDVMRQVFFDKTTEKVYDKDSDTTKFDLNDRHGIVGKNTFIFYTDKGTKLDDAASYFIHNPNSEYMNTETELSFAPRSSLPSAVNDFVNNLGINPDDIYIENIYSITKEGFDFYKEYLSELAKSEDDDRIRKQSESVSKITSEDFYFIDLGVKMNDLPVYSGGAYFYGTGENDTFAGTKFSLIYTKSGVEYVVIMYLYQEDNLTENSKILDFSDAQFLLKEKYDNIFFDNEIVFTDAKLMYLPFPQNTLSERFEKFILRPYYAFYGYQEVKNNDEKYISDIIVYFDAVTGKEL